MTREVIIGDSKWEKKAVAELKEVDYGKETRWFIGDTEFDGHHTLWGFEYFPTTYLKSSGLSGNEYRKGGEIRYFKDRKQCFSEFCREPDRAVFRIAATLPKLMEFDWNLLKVGKQVFYENTLASIDMVLEDQGCVVLKTIDGKKFPDPVWKDKDMFGELEESVKVEIFDPKIWWYVK